MDFDFGGINGTVSCLLWTNRPYVGISASLNEFVGVITWCRIVHYGTLVINCTPIAHVLFQFTPTATTHATTAPD